MIKKLKISLSLFLILLLTLGQIGPRVVLAEETGDTGIQTETTDEPTDPPADPPAETAGTEGSETSSEDSSQTTEAANLEPTPTPEVGIDNEAGVTNDIDSTANTGENTIEEPTPTPTPEDAIGPGEVQGEGEGDSTGTTETTDPTDPGATVGNEGEVGETNEEPSPTPSPAEIDTGDAVSVVEGENSVNSTEVNSQILYQTLNIFVPQEGDIDLSALPLVLVDQIFYQGNNTDPVVNVMAINNQNFAYLSNEIVSFANTGNNSVEGADQATINTGDAYSIVSLLNKVNTTIIDSTIHVVTINIFGGVDGNLLLPELFPEEEGCCGEAVQVDNTAVVENEVDSTANTGQNSIVSNEGGSIETGDANSVVNVVNIVNTTLVDVIFHYLYINSLGLWTGNFLGLDSLEGAEGGESLFLSSVNSNGGEGSCPTCVGEVTIGNQAYVYNQISSTANTGENSIDGNGGTITTGNAYSAVSLINLVNTSIIRSLGFFGFINIFGFLSGDIGGASLFAEPEAKPEAVEATSQQGEPGPFIREEGGLLEVSQTTNVGTHVLPGDTITFFVTVRNPGTGIVYDTHLRISLLKDGVDLGGGVFKLNDIHPGKGVRVTTGLVLSEEAQPGEYVALAEAWGLVGPGDTEIFAFDESEFLIGGFALPPAMPVIIEEAQATEEDEVLGAVAPSRGMTREEALRLLFLGMPMTYLAMTGIRRRKEVALAWSRHRSTLGTRSAAALRSLATLLSSFLS